MPLTPSPIAVKARVENIIHHVAQSGTQDIDGQVEVYRRVFAALLNVASLADLDAAVKALGDILESEDIPLSKDIDLDEVCEDIREIRAEMRSLANPT